MAHVGVPGYGKEQNKSFLKVVKFIQSPFFFFLGGGPKNPPQKLTLCESILKAFFKLSTIFEKIGSEIKKENFSFSMEKGVFSI